MNSSHCSSRSPSVWLVALIGGAIALGAAFFFGSRAARRSAGLEDEVDPSTMWLEEIAAEDSRLELLEKRLDREVRARLDLEERLSEARDELKVLQDQLLEPARRDGPAS